MSARKQLTIDSLAAGGDGVARDETGRVTFVPGTVPGDQAWVELRDQHPSYARGELVELVVAGASRRAPVCELFARRACGGCQWQHVAIAEQRAAKERIVAGALRHAVAAGMRVAPIETPVPDLGWRRRARLHWVRARGSGAAIIGLCQPGSRRITDVDMCPQLTESGNAILAVVRQHLAAGLHKRGELSLLVGADGRGHVVIHGPCTARVARALAADPRIAGVRVGRRLLGQPAVAVEHGLTAAADGFVQASVAGNDAIRDLVDRAARPRGQVLELYAGNGNLTERLVDGAERVVAVEKTPGYRERDRVEWRSESADRAVRRLRKERRRFDWVVLDPPRTGAADVLGGVAALATRGVIYVSCDPATLARDVAALSQRGFRPVFATPIDTMPQTAHVEVVCVLQR